MKKTLVYLISCIGLIALTSCGTEQKSLSSQKSLYAWNNYEETSYLYYKKQSPEALLALQKTYEDMINKPGGVRNVVPPGTYAEYGYLLMMNGKKDEGLKMFKTEMELYPESTTFMSLLIKKFEQ